MSDKVFISGQNHDNAVLLLAAAEDLEVDVAVVATVDGGFSVPVEVAEAAGFDSDGRPKRAAAKKAADPAPDPGADKQEKPAKKTAPRRRAAKQAAPGNGKE